MNPQISAASTVAAGLIVGLWLDLSLPRFTAGQAVEDFSRHHETERKIRGIYCLVWLLWKR